MDVQFIVRWKYHFFGMRGENLLLQKHMQTSEFQFIFDYSGTDV